MLLSLRGSLVFALPVALLWGRGRRGSSRGSMYHTCIYCHRDLGSNERVEHFPVGRQLAFDTERGRLWVVCGRCRRWNLSPLEERWEAIEECDRLFSDTPTRYSTDQIGLAQLRGAFSLVRIGRPQRREFAAWRYGTELIRRRTRKIVATSVKAGAWAAAFVAALAVGHVWLPWFGSFTAQRTVLRVRGPDGRWMYFPKGFGVSARLVRDGTTEGWHLSVACYRGERRKLFLRRVTGDPELAAFKRQEGIYMAGRILPAINSFGGTSARVQEAVSLIQEVDRAEAFFHAQSEKKGRYRPDVWGADPSRNLISNMDAEVRLALEMLAHEETERRALEGELRILEAAWEEAEEVAAIADRLLIPSEIEDWIERHRDRYHAGPGR